MLDNREAASAYEGVRIDAVLEVKIKGGLITELPVRRLVQEIKFHV